MLFLLFEGKKRKDIIDQKIKDSQNWQLGQYHQIAIGSSMDNKVKYPEKPKFSTFEEEVVSEEEVDQISDALFLYFQNINKK